MALSEADTSLAEANLARTLLTAAAVRERCREMLALAEAGKLDHWQVERLRLPAIADYVIETMLENYPTLDIPFHARWRHFAVGGRDRWAELVAKRRWPNAAAKGRAAFDLAIVSVLLDAGAGPDWRYHSEDTTFSRSEGLAVASFDMFMEGAFSADPSDALRVDAARLVMIQDADIMDGFQVDAGNPLVGVEGRAALLRALGQTVFADTAFARADTPRPGGIFDYVVEKKVKNNTLPAPIILETVLTHLGPIWPSRLSLGGVTLGDCWRHPALKRANATDGLVPFHKLSQWLSYSLIEPLQWAGIDVTDIDGLTGLPEYRNGGLFMDLGAIVVKDSGAASALHQPSSPLVVEWRALTVALLNEVADLIRQKLGMDTRSLPLAKVLEGGTWAAGRRIARDRRADGSPPLTIASDGTLF